MTKKMKLEGTLALSCLSSVLFFVFVLAFPEEANALWEWLLKMAGD